MKKLLGVRLWKSWLKYQGWASLWGSYWESEKLLGQCLQSRWWFTWLLFVLPIKEHHCSPGKCSETIFPQFGKLEISLHFLDTGEADNSRSSSNRTNHFFLALDHLADRGFTEAPEVWGPGWTECIQEYVRCHISDTAGGGLAWALQGHRPINCEGCTGWCRYLRGLWVCFGLVRVQSDMIWAKT